MGNNSLLGNNEVNISKIDVIIMKRWKHINCIMGKFGFIITGFSICSDVLMT